MIHTALPMIAVFAITTLISKPVIEYLRKLKFGNTEREYIESHKAKNGTPSIGGLLFLIPVAIVSGIYCIYNPQILPVLLLTIGFAVIGFIDDYLKVVKKDKDGFKAGQKFLCEILVTAAFAVYMYKFSPVDLTLRLPFMTGHLNIGFLAVPLLFVAVLGTVNGTNFTDGLDGLLTNTTLPVCMFLMVCANRFNPDLNPIIAAMTGGLLAFLIVNCHPAKVFMGDTGSLAIGAFVIGCAYMMNMPLFIILIGAVYLMEVLSVILQVGHFKLTHGKRIFRMAPIHHHFELGGWNEVKISAVFFTITSLLCVFSYYLLG